MFDLKLLEVLSSEKEYRAHPAMNYSKLKYFVTKPLLAYKKKYVDNLPDEEENSGMKNGTLLDIRLLGNEEDFNSRFFVADIPDPPKPQYLRFCEHLISLDEDEGFGDRCLKAYELAGISTPLFPKFMDNFKDNGTEDYYNFMLEAKGKTVITFSDLEGIDFAANTLRTDENTKDIFTGDGINQLPIVYEYEGVAFKILVDRIKVDHDKKIIRPFDLKSCYSPEDFEYHYLKMRYDIQNAIYSNGVKAWAKVHYPDYTVEPFSFLVTDIPAYHRPLVYTFEFTGANNPWFGFTHRGRNYKGIWKALEELNWHQSTGEWKISKESLNKKGKLTIKIGD